MSLTVTDLRILPGDSGFLIDDGTTAILCDSGFGFTGDAMADRLAGLLGSRELDYILLTHSHYDHVLGSVAVARRYPDARIIAGEYARQIFKKPSARAVMRELDRKYALQQGITDYVDVTNGLRVDLSVQDGDTLMCGGLELSVIALPGHTKCSVGFYSAEHRFLIGTETLGVYLGRECCLPSYLVGYQMTLDSIRRARSLDIRQILLPHYGVIEGEEVSYYLELAERMAKETAHQIRQLLAQGVSKEEILLILKEQLYREQVAPTYPIDAFNLNTGIMINLIERELPFTSV